MNGLPIVRTGQIKYFAERLKVGMLEEYLKNSLENEATMETLPPEEPKGGQQKRTTEYASLVGEN